MSARTGAPTRQHLLRLQRRLAHVERGQSLLRRKREALVGELFRLARPAVQARVSIAEAAEQAYGLLAEALAVEGSAGLARLGAPARELRVALRGGSVWGIPVTELTDLPPVRRTLAARGLVPASAGTAAHLAADAFERLTESLLAAAGREALLRRLGDALRRTTRQVNALERRLAPALTADVRRIREALEEREREERGRLGRMKRRGFERAAGTKG